jgi:hypothetical protein
MLKIFIPICFFLLLLAGCSSVPVGDQGKILSSINDVNKIFPSENWLYLKIDYIDEGKAAMVIRKGGCGYIEKFNMNLCYKDNILTIDGVKIYFSPLWLDGFTYHLPNGEITIKQITSSQTQENLW